MWLICVVLQQKSTQHCKAVILQLKIKNKITTKNNKKNSNSNQKSPKQSHNQTIVSSRTCPASLLFSFIF